MGGKVSYICKRYSKANNKYKRKWIISTSTFLPTIRFKWVHYKEFDLNKYTSSSSKGCVLEIDLEYPKELCELHNDYPLAPDKLEMKKEMLPKYQQMISDFFNSPISNVKELLPNYFCRGKYLLHYENLNLYLRLELRLKKASCIRIQTITIAKTIYWIQTKKNRSRRKWRQRWKTFYKIMNNVVYEKAHYIKT